MADTPDTFEARLVGYSKQTRKDGDWIELRLHIHPESVTRAIEKASLGTMFMVAAVPVEAGTGSQDAPVEEPEKKQPTISNRAALMCGLEIFWRFLEQRNELSNHTVDNEMATAIVRSICIVKSRAEFDSDPEAAKRWDALLTEFECWKIA